jgi:flagellar biosynthesis/type III secretory pathway protein FliH
MLVAKRVIAREVQSQPEFVTDLVREGVDALAVRDRVRVNLGSGFSELAATLAEQLGLRGIEVDVRVSSSLSEYGCLVETDIGRVDESVETRLDLLIQSIARETEV